jgi:hypothetical protein
MPLCSDRLINATIVDREKSGKTRMYLPVSNPHLRGTSWFDNPSLHWLVNWSADMIPPMSAARGAARRIQLRRAVALCVGRAGAPAKSTGSIAARLSKNINSSR